MAKKLIPFLKLINATSNEHYSTANDIAYKACPYSPFRPITGQLQLLLAMGALERVQANNDLIVKHKYMVLSKMYYLATSKAKMRLDVLVEDLVYDVMFLERWPVVKALSTIRELPNAVTYQGLLKQMDWDGPSIRSLMDLLVELEYVVMNKGTYSLCGKSIDLLDSLSS